ncbi:hypothetical protein P43SY_004351 [Pythium insidiosum]|uniref:RNA helicase n=1 Tax=Pythium insidiosum TaxID=114742 RepID=A0AAD5M1T8_PYTIN|nr:hypothetical protein P43SY_004351 [Pythium insidiosum]
MTAMMAMITATATARRPLLLRRAAAAFRVSRAASALQPPPLLSTGVVPALARADSSWGPAPWWPARSFSTDNSAATGAELVCDRPTGRAAGSAAGSEIKWPADAAKLVNRRLKFFPRDYEVRELAIEAGLNPEQWGVASSSFRQSFMKHPELYFQDQQELQHFVADVNHGQKKRNTFVFYPHFLEFAREKDYIPRTGEGSFTLQQITDLRLPHQLYPLANAMQRRIIYHQGPTNSGKTYQALERLKSAGEGGGLYCGPLRLLALEIYERLNMDGVYTSLVTGQEKKIMPHATHVSCTVEMANINRKWDVAVIDEIQLIGDPQRGWAWTRALFGLQANEIHVCGSGEAVDLIEKFAQSTGDVFEVRSYERRSPLEIDARHLNSYRHVRAGDCVVAFSRRELFQIKRDIEVKTGQKCCIIYGQLPPETRSQQARLFNARDNDYNILVASDAVGMGLNLNIGRVVFSSVKKYNGGGGGMADISPSLAKQIAGRAGRFGSAFGDGGVATTLSSEDLKYLRDSYDAPVIPLKSAGLFPSSEQMEEFAKQLPGVTDLGDLLDKYVTLARLDGDYFMCNHVDMKDAAGLLRDLDMKLSDRFTFCQAPVNIRNPLARRVFMDYARAHSRDESVKLDIYLPRFAPQSPDTLRDVEIKAQIIDLYLWLSFRFDTTFVEHELALEMKGKALELVEQGLINTTYHSKKARKQQQQHQRDGTRPDHSRHVREDTEVLGGWRDRVADEGHDFRRRVHERIMRGLRSSSHVSDPEAEEDEELTMKK